jgi:opacity protein-like surface antigen
VIGHETSRTLRLQQVRHTPSRHRPARPGDPVITAHGDDPLAGRRTGIHPHPRRLLGAPHESAQTSLDYLGTVRGRLGYVFTPAVLVYGTGGLAYGRVNSSVTISQQADVPFVDNGPTFSSGSDTQTRTGWTAGAGAEWMFLQNWIARIEYLHYDLGSVTYSAGTRTAFVGAIPVWTHVSTASTSFRGDIVRVGLNYKFF